MITLLALIFSTAQALDSSDIGGGEEIHPEGRQAFSVPHI